VKPREVNFSESSTEKGMNQPEVVEYYNKLMNYERFIFKRIAKRALCLMPDAQVIADIGTGPGYLAIELAKKSGKIVKAIDISPNMLKKAKDNAKKAGVEIEVIESNCESLPFADHSVSLLTSSNMIHMLEDPLPFIKEVKRVCKPGGKALISGFKRNPWWIITDLAEFHSKVICKNKPLEGMANVIDASFTSKEFEDMLTLSGLTNHRVFTGFLRLEAVVGFI
jgi:ubiquinone/menaquinone biosynthesis C-methylase UbiE